MERRRRGERKKELSEVSPDRGQLSLINGFVSHTKFKGAVFGSSFVCLFVGCSLCVDLRSVVRMDSSKFQIRFDTEQFLNNKKQVDFKDINHTRELFFVPYLPDKV